jgi:hypothetical protein
MQFRDHRHWHRALAPRAPEAEHETADRRHRMTVDRPNVDRTACPATGTTYVELRHAGHERGPDRRRPPQITAGRAFLAALPFELHALPLHDAWAIWGYSRWRPPAPSTRSSDPRALQSGVVDHRREGPGFRHSALSGQVIELIVPTTELVPRWSRPTRSAIGAPTYKNDLVLQAPDTQGPLRAVLRNIGSFGRAGAARTWRRVRRTQSRVRRTLRNFCIAPISGNILSFQLFRLWANKRHSLGQDRPQLAFPAFNKQANLRVSEVRVRGRNAEIERMWSSVRKPWANWLPISTTDPYPSG